MMEEERRKGVKERNEREMAGSSDGRSEWYTCIWHKYSEHTVLLDFTHHIHMH